MKSGSSYHVKNKRKNADFYGTWVNGIQTRSERINGRTITYNNVTGEWK